MTITHTLEDNITTIKTDIMPHLADEFTSHEFIETFAKRFEWPYIQALYQFGRPGAFQQVHSDIGRFLANHAYILGIEKIAEKGKGRTVFGEDTPVQQWRKIIE